MSATDAARTAFRTVFGSTGRAVNELDASDEVLRTPLPLSRRVGFVSLCGGSGTTAVTSSIASLLARRRTGMVLAADAAGGRSGLRRQLCEGRDDGQEPAAEPEAAERSTDLEEDAARRRLARTAAEARHGLEKTESGLFLLDLAEPGRRPPLVSAWADELAPIVRFYDLVLTDWGVRPAAMDLAEVAGTGHVLVLVSRAERAAATAAAEAIEALRNSAEGAEAGPTMMLALADVGRSSDRMVRSLRAGLQVPVSVLPYDRSRITRTRQGSRDFSVATRTAHIRLAAAVMAQVVEGQTSGVRMPARTVPTRAQDESAHRPRHGGGLAVDES